MSHQPGDRLLHRLTWLGFAAILAFAPAVVRAGVSNEVLVLRAVSALGSGEFRVYFSDGIWTPSQQRLQWTLGGATAIVDPGNGAVICTLRSASLTLRKHCRIQISFELDAGASQTDVTIQSAYLWFPELAAGVAQGQASGSFAGSDLNGDSVTLVGLSGGGAGILRAVYNGVAPDGVLFSNLVGQIYAGAGGTASGSQADPPSGYRMLAQAVSSMSLRIGFSITAGDRAGGSCNFRFIPEPSCTDDSDGDGTPDCLDDCPDDALKIGPGVCGCGQSDGDSDGDGVLDCLDGCPGDPLKTAPGTCGCGQVDDADGDGVPDCTPAPGSPGGGESEPEVPPQGPGAPGAPDVPPAGTPRLAPDSPARPEGDERDDPSHDDQPRPVDSSGNQDGNPDGIPDDVVRSDEPRSGGSNGPARNSDLPDNLPAANADAAGNWVKSPLDELRTTLPGFAPCGAGMIPTTGLLLLGLLGGRRLFRKAPAFRMG